MPERAPAATPEPADAAPSDDATRRRLHADGRRHLADGLIGRAIEALSQAADLDPEDGAVLADLGAAYAAADDPHHALPILRLALTADPFSFTAHAALAEALAAAADSDGAHRHRLAAIGAAVHDLPAPPSPPHLYAAALAELGDAAFAAHRPADAQRLEDAARALWPECPEALALAGRRLRREGRGDDALAVLVQAVAARPERIETRLDLAALLVERGRHDEAAEAYQPVLDRHPDHAEALRGLSAVHRKEKRHDLALAPARRLAAREPRDAWAQAHLGQVEAALGHAAEAVAAFRAAQALDSDLPDIAETLAEQLLVLGQRAEAAKALGLTAAQRPRDAALLRRIGDLHAAVGEPGEAVVWYRRALELGDDAELRRVLATALLGCGRWPECLDEFDRLAREARPDLIQPDWTAAAPHDRPVLVHADGLTPAQEVRFMGAVARLLAEGAPVTLDCAPERVDLWRAVLPAATVIARPEGANLAPAEVAGRISLPDLLRRQLIDGHHPAPAQDSFLSIIAADAVPGAERLARTFVGAPEAPPRRPPADRLPIEIRDTLNRIPRLAMAMDGVRCQRLSGGFHNDIHRIDAPSGSYVLRQPKFPSPGWFFYVEEGHNMALAHGRGIAPKLHYFDTADGAMLIDFVPGRVLDYDSFLTAENLEAAARGYRALHAGPAFLGRYDIFELTDKNLARIGDPAASDFAPLPGLIRRLAEVRRALEANDVPMAPCHNDPIPSNFIVADGRAMLIDWQCSAMTDPHWELGALAAQLNLSAEPEDILLAAYFGDPGHPGTARVRLYKSACWHYWLTLALAKRREDEPRKNWEDDMNTAARRLQRFLNREEFPALLKRVRRYRHHPLWSRPDR